MIFWNTLYKGGFSTNGRNKKEIEICVEESKAATFNNFLSDSS